MFIDNSFHYGVGCALLCRLPLLPLLRPPLVLALHQLRLQHGNLLVQPPLLLSLHPAPLTLRHGTALFVLLVL